jgi:hypothetical protein
VSVKVWDRKTDNFAHSVGSTKQSRRCFWLSSTHTLGDQIQARGYLALIAKVAVGT